MPPTMSPRRARFVIAAIHPSAVQPSSIGSSTAPTPRIWNRWSMTQMESKPISSAVLTIRSRVGAMAGVPPGYVNESICKPSFMDSPSVKQIELGRDQHVPDRAFAADERGAADDRHGAGG